MRGADHVALNAEGDHPGHRIEILGFQPMPVLLQDVRLQIRKELIKIEQGLFLLDDPLDRQVAKLKASRHRMPLSVAAVTLAELVRFRFGK